ncbi:MULTISPECIES: MobF family relaxase [Nocardia]|uniref:MobF family relaxase n=1 Tax=Nocardia TaxID=1817 RepID=UPI0018E4FE4C|nr:MULTISPECIES: MobF family relaxase [Nocardia]
MTATLHKITAGDGYLYYIRQVAVHDASDRGRSALADYYSARGETPGTWLGSGLPGLTVTYRDRTPEPEPAAGLEVDREDILVHPDPEVDPDPDPYPVRDMEGSRINSGDIVTEEQMHALFGLGMHPQADAITAEIRTLELSWGAPHAMAEKAAEKASRLGSPFRIYSGETAFRQQCARAFSEYNTDKGLGVSDPIPDEVRARIRTAVAHGMFRFEFGRDPLTERELSGWVARNSRQQTTAVAGYGVCFSGPKSVSVFRALAPMPVAALAEQADRLAVQDAIDYLETDALYTRVGRNGVRQVDVEGLIAARFEHRDSRSGDPDFHTHIVIANRVRTLEDGQWRTVDGSMLYKSLVTASEIYNTRLEHHLETLLGLRFAPRPGTDPNKRPIREIVGVPVELIEHFSRRDAAITVRLGQLTVEFQKRLGRDPTSREMYELMERATLGTRPRKHLPRSLAEQRADWLAQAIEVLGTADLVRAMTTRALHPVPPRRPRLVGATIERWADQVIDTISAERSIWRVTHVRSETERVIRGKVAPHQWALVADAVTDAALAPTRSVPRGDPDRAAEPAVRAPPQVFRRADGTSAFTTAGDQLYTSVQTLSTEAHLISMITESRGRVTPADVVEAAITEFNTDPAHRDRQLNQGQEAVIQAFATSGLGIQITDAPAGTGKTTAMRVLTRAWLTGGGSVCGLAPTAKAAGELAEEISAPVNTVDKLLHVLDSHTPTFESLVFRAGRPPPSLPQWILDIDDTTLVIIDEHVQIPDQARLRVLIFLLGRGATVRMLGDQYQLQSIDAGGSARDMIHAAGGSALTLTHVVRFADRAESAASLAVREGDPSGLGFYLDRDRVHIGSPAAVVDSAFRAWLADHSAGRDTIMLAATHTVVAELNTLAREHRLAGTEDPGPEVALGDGAAASVGDTIRTTSNNRRIRCGDSDFVRNGYQWTVTEVHADGALTAIRQLGQRRHGDTVYLPADYVAEHTRLGYAATINSVQGITADTCHTVLTGHESRYQLYVALTRGRGANHLYVTTALDGNPEESFWTERAVLPRTATDILVAILGRDDAVTSAHAELRKTLDPHTRIGRLADVYLEAVAVASEAALGPDAMARIDLGAETLLPTLTTTAGWPVLRRHLATLALSGRDPLIALGEAIGSRELSTADNIAAVLDWRLDTTGNHSTPPGPLPWLSGIPTTLREHPEFGDYLTALARIVVDLAHQLRTTAAGFTVSTAPVWARPLIGTDPDLLAELLVWRAAAHVSPQDLRPAGPARHTVAERRHRHRLALRATEAIGDAHLAAIVWAAEVKHFDERITDDPFWPVLAERLDTAHRAGIDVPAQLAAAIAPRPLPDDMPAAALWFRLHLDTATPLLDTTGPTLNPSWTPDLAVVLGEDTAARIIADPAWPTVVAAVEHALTTTDGDDRRAWTALELLTVAGDLLLDGRSSERDRLRPDQLATALAWRIDALTEKPDTHLPPTTSLEPPPESDPEPEEHPIPDDVAELLATPPEHTMAHPGSDLDTGDQPDDTLHAEDYDEDEPRSQQALTELAVRIREVYAHFARGETKTAYALLAELPLTENDRATVRRVAKTLTEYAFPIAKARLRHAAATNPGLAPIIDACTPDEDPGMYRRRQDSSWVPPSNKRQRVDPARIHTREQRRDSGRDAADRHNRIDDGSIVADIIQPNADTRTLRDSDAEYGSGQETPTTTRFYRDGTPLHLACVGCELDLPARDLPTIDPVTGRFANADGLCSDCRADDRPGIPAHDPTTYTEYFRQRCAFVTASRPAAEARAFLHRDWRRSPVPIRTTIEQWAIDHNLTAESARTDTTPDTAAPTPSLLELTDAELDQHISELTQQIALATNLDAAQAAHSDTPAAAVAPQRWAAATEAIAAVHAARAEVEAIETQIREVASITAATRATLAAAPRRKRAELTGESETLKTAKQQLITRRDDAQQKERDAHRHAVVLAGPPDRWAETTRTPHAERDRTPQAPNPTPSSQSSAEQTRLRTQLGAVHEERNRRQRESSPDSPLPTNQRGDAILPATEHRPVHEPGPEHEHDIGP